MSDNMENLLDEELRILEGQLATLVPSALKPETMVRMQQLVTSGSAAVLDEGDEVVEDHDDGFEHDLNELELHLDSLKPASMPEDMLMRMSAAMDRWQDRAETNVVKFDQEITQSQTKSSKGRGFAGNMWSAAAAVAILGAVTALMFPHVGQKGKVIASSPGPEASGSVVATQAGSTLTQPAAWTTSDRLSHKVTRTSDEGVVMAGDNTPHRCIRVDYINRIRAKDAHGHEMEIKTPGVDYMLIPVETN